MATTFSSAGSLPRRAGKDFGHRLRMGVATFAVTVFFLTLAYLGRDYYPADLAERAENPLHPMLRPSGTIGLRLGMVGIVAFLILALYPLRKRWRWLASIGKTSHWLDFHALVGIAAPILVTFHASFKFGGLAGTAYWIMIAVALSGFVGRYLYSQVPRRLNATALDMSELAQQAAELAVTLDEQFLIPAEVIAPLVSFPSSEAVRRMSMLQFLTAMLRSDLARPLLVARMRRRVLRGSQRLVTLGGWLPSGNPALEAVIAAARRRSWLGTKIAFLHRVQQLFQLWHVVHRPFSISFAVLVLVHIGVVISLGYF